MAAGRDRSGDQLPDAAPWPTQKDGTTAPNSCATTSRAEEGDPIAAAPLPTRREALVAAQDGDGRVDEFGDSTARR